MTRIILNTNDDGTVTATTDDPAVEAFALGPADEPGKTPMAVQGHGQVIFDDHLQHGSAVKSPRMSLSWFAGTSGRRLQVISLRGFWEG